MTKLRSLGILGFLGYTIFTGRVTEAADQSDQRCVLVELYTSQGCDMCPTAEKVLGALAEKDRRVVPIAFHVDYFNNPWKDIFSDPLYSQRQAVYNQLYTKPKPESYGLYYTPMLMIDGDQSVNGRDPNSAEAAIKQALNRKPLVGLKVDFEPKADGLSATANIKVTSKSSRAEKDPVLICAVVREDAVATDVPSGENAGKRLVNRYPARYTKFEFVELNAKAPTTVRLPLAIEAGWNQKALRVAVFAQDRKTGVIFQAADFPWPTVNSTKTASNNKTR